MNSRDQFETTIKAPPYEHKCSRHGPNAAWPGHYRRYETQLAWEFWEHGRAALEGGELAEIARMQHDRIAELETELAEARVARDGYAQNAAFYRCCAMSGEVPAESAEPYKPAGQGGEG